MEFNCTAYIVDAIMGSGKTQGVMNMIKESSEEEKFLVITPYLQEIKRYQAFCPERNFKAPSFANGTTKLADIKKLIGNGKNIVATHALFLLFDDEVIELCQEKNYTLILDEVADVVTEYEMTNPDYKLLVNELVDIDPDTHRLLWREDIESKKYRGSFDTTKKYCERKMLVTYGENVVVKVFPIEIFNAFQRVFVLTYRFDLQIQKYYFDVYGLSYKYLSIEGDSLDTYHLVEYDSNISYVRYDYKELIHIVDMGKINEIGDGERDLSKSWYKRNEKEEPMLILKNNLKNFFQNVRKSKSSDNLWTTFKAYKNCLKGKGYTKGFLELNARATNEFKDRTSIAYPVNRFMNPYITNFFKFNGIEVDEEGYALTEMLQFIWRSAVRDGKEIWVYVPSYRMRSLLQEWIEDNPKSND